MEKQKKEEPSQHDLVGFRYRTVLMLLRRFWALLLILAVIGGGLAFLISRRQFHPLYKTEAVFEVRVSYNGNTDILNNSGHYFGNTAAELAAKTFPNLLESDVMQQLLQQELGTPYIPGSITAMSVAETSLFVLEVTSSVPQDAYNVIRAVIDVYPQVSQQVIGDTQLRISKEPVLPTAPFNSFSWKRDSAIGAGIGLLIGLSLLVLLAMLRKTVISSDDVKKMLNLNCLSHVPDVPVKRRAVSKENGLLITKKDSDSPFSESFRLLRLNLIRKLSENDKVILVTSTIPSEGKSSISTNIALSLARDDKKVLLIDADLRGPSVKHILNLTTPSTGLGHYLANEVDKVCFLHVPDTSLYVFADDEIFDDPTSLLTDARLAHIIGSARKHFDYIVIDTPPCHLLADAVTISRYVDKTVYVIRKDFANTAQIYDGVQFLSAGGAEICGFVLNRASSSGHGGHYGYGYGYGHGKHYGYGYGYGYGSRYGYGKRYGYGYGHYGSSKKKHHKSDKSDKEN